MIKKFNNSININTTIYIYISLTFFFFLCNNNLIIATYLIINNQ